MIPLVVHSYYSLMRGVNSPRRICQTARRRGFTHLALTDTDNLYGLWPFLAACRETQLVPIIGTELTDPCGGGRVICLAADQAGYRNLCRLITARHGRRDFKLAAGLIAHARGVIMLTDTAELLAVLHTAGVTAAAAVAGRPHTAGRRLRAYAQAVGAPVVAVPDSYFCEPDEFDRHRLVRAIALNTSLARLPASQTASPDAWLASPDEYRRRFAVWPEVIPATVRLMQQIEFTGPSTSVIMPPWPTKDGRHPEQVLRTAAYRGACWRYGADLAENVVSRLEHELAMIARKNFSAYFLVVQDIVARSPRICGRGSGAASLVAYCLGITNVCPVKHNLYFERFLNPGRSDPPDIDVDFAWDERDGVIESVLAQYAGCSALVCNHVGFQPRSAIRETAKVYGLPAAEIGRVTKRLPWFWEGRLTEPELMDNLKRLPELGRFDFPAPWPAILGLAQRLIGQPRCLSVHPGGLVITPGPIDAFAPVQPAPKKVPVVQWEKEGVEQSGLVKIDLLGNRSLGVIRDAVANLRANAVRFDEHRWQPEDDPATQAALARGDTMGCFYIESPAMRLLQQKTGVGDFEHLVIHSSIIRPAANDCIREYIRRLHGAAWQPIHPLLTDVLDETLGVMVYQEDVAKTAVALAGFSHADADGLRKIMSRKDKKRRLQDYQRRFDQGARQRGVSDEQIDAVWQMMLSFSGYSFCKPHSASYARVSFQAAYLKTHFPAEFMAAVLSNQGGFYSAFAYVSEARRMGLTILPPDVNLSDIRWRGREKRIRVGLAAVKPVKTKTIERIVAARRVRPYRDFADFLTRVAPDEAEAQALIDAGAVDHLTAPGGRTQLSWVLACRRRTRETPAAGQLFNDHLCIPAPRLPQSDRLTELRRQYRALGFLCDCHPMTLFEPALSGQRIVKTVRLKQLVGQTVMFAGFLITGKVVYTRNGETMQFLTFEDDTGLVETTFFPRAYRQFCTLLTGGRPFLVHGRVEQDFGAVTVTVHRVQRLSLKRKKPGDPR